MGIMIYVVLLGMMYYVTYLSSATSLLGTSMAHLAEVFPFPFLPEGRVFMVAWTLIYLLLAAFMIHARYHYIRTQQTQSRIMMLFGATCITNALWLVCTGKGWHIGAIIMIVLLLRELAAILILYKKRFLQGSIGWYAFGAYYGWVSIATLVLALSQGVFLVAPQVVFSPVWIGVVFLLAIGFTLCSWVRLKNPAALALSLFGLLGAILAVLHFYRVM